MAKKQNEIFESEWFIAALLTLGGFIFILQIIAFIKGIDGVMYGTTAAALGGIGGFLLKGYLKK